MTFTRGCLRRSAPERAGFCAAGKARTVPRCSSRGSGQAAYADARAGGELGSEEDAGEGVNASAGARASGEAGAGENAGGSALDGGNKDICGFAGARASWLRTLRAGFQSVEEPQRLQKRMTPSLVAQISASMPLSSIFSRVLQELHASEKRPISRSRGLTGGKSRPQKLRLGSRKATP